MLKGGEILGKGQQLCRITKHFFLAEKPGCRWFCRHEAGRKDYFLCPLPRPGKDTCGAAECEEQLLWYRARYPPKALLAERHPAFPASLCCVHQRRQSWGARLLRGDSLSSACASTASCPAQREYKARSLLPTVQIKQQDGVKRHVPCYQLMYFCPCKHDNVFRLLMQIQEQLHLISWRFLQ